MRKLRTLLIAVLLIAVYSKHSTAQKYSEIYLKNGSIIQGKISENCPDSIIKIKDKCGNLMVYKYEEIQKIQNDNVKPTYIESQPFQIGLKTGLYAFGGSYDTGGGLLISGTYKVNDYFSAGIVSGIEYFDIPVLPVAAEFQADIYKRKTTPYIYVNGGYGFKLISDEKNEEYIVEYTGGIMFGTGVGIKKRFSSEFALTFSVGYRYQQRNEMRNYLYPSTWTYDYIRLYKLNRTAIFVGFIF
jgi:hypothetical protein